MIFGKKTSVPFFLALFTLINLNGAFAQDQRTRIVIKTVLASQGPEYVDPRLSDLVKELKSVFRYSSYRLLAQNTLSLGPGERGAASLPGDRRLSITSLSRKGDRVSLKLSITRKGKDLFSTNISLLNRSNMTVGGPKYKKGYLLFSIFASF